MARSRTMNFHSSQLSRRSRSARAAPYRKICLYLAKKRSMGQKYANYCVGSGVLLRGLRCVRDILFLLLFLFKFQLSKLPGEVDPEGPVGDPPETVQGKIAACDCGLLVDILADGIGNGKGDAAFFVPELFPHGDAIGGERRIPALDLIAGRTKITKKLRNKRGAELPGGIEVDAIVEAVDRRAAEGSGHDIAVEHRDI